MEFGFFYFLALRGINIPPPDIPAKVNVLTICKCIVLNHLINTHGLFLTT